MALIDEIRKRLEAQKASLPTAQTTSQQLQGLLQAKTGGVSAPGQSPKASMLGAEAAQANVQQAATQQSLEQQLASQQLGEAANQQAQQQQLAQQQLTAQRQMTQAEMAAKGTMAREELSGNEVRARVSLTAQEEMKTDAINGQYRNKINEMTSQRNIAVDDLFRDFSQSMEELDFRKDAAQLEQTAFQLAMKDKKYLQELQSVAKVRDLQNSLTFRKEAAILKFGEVTSSLLDELGWRRAFDADTREFTNMMSGMDIANAIRIADASISDSNKSMIASGVIQGVKSGVNYSVNNNTTSSANNGGFTSVSQGAGNETTNNLAYSDLNQTEDYSYFK
jgi:hypothetical protein